MSRVRRSPWLFTFLDILAHDLSRFSLTSKESRDLNLLRTFYFQDILENEDVKLDSMFVSSLVVDLIKVNL